MIDGHCFISYSGADGLDFATRLADKLQGQHPFFKMWFDKRELSSSSPEDWDDQLASAIKACKCLIFVMTEDSTAEGSVCKAEWTWALKYKKPVITVRKDTKAEVPFRLNNRQHVDFVKNFDVGIAQLRAAITRLDSPVGILEDLKQRLADANRDLHRAKPEDQLRIQSEIEELKKQIDAQQKVVDDPGAAEEQTQKNIQAGLERERRPEKPIVGKGTTKFINPPPGIAPTYFQDRTDETREVVRFLNDESQRLLTVVGRGGVGKTAAVCRLLKHIENGTLPDDLERTFGETKVDGIVYLSESGGHRVSFANIFADLSKLLPMEIASSLDITYRNPQISTSAKMSALLDQFTDTKVILLLDNLEPLINVETFGIGDSELDEALCTFLRGAHSSLKIISTTRIAPRGLNLCEPGRQRVLSLDEGLESPYAENILREMDFNGKLGLRNAPDRLLAHAREHTRGYPRALEALFAILSSDRYTSLEEILTTAENYLPDYVVQSLVGEAFSRLDGNAQKVMQALAIYNRPVTPAAVDYILAPHLPGIDSAPVLNRLVAMQFVRRETGRYYLHPVDQEFAVSRIPTEQSELGWDQKSLTLHAADYFAQARKPRTEWKKLDDLAAQLAEFELRCEVGDYDTACGVLRGIDFDYLLLWGHYRLTIDSHLKLRDKISDINLRMGNLNILGLAHDDIGRTRESIDFYHQGLNVAREVKNRTAESTFLVNLGNSYAGLGDVHKANEFYELALVIDRETGDRNGEGIVLGSLGNGYAELGDTYKAVEFYEQTLVIFREINNRKNEGILLGNLAQRLAEIEDYQKAVKYGANGVRIAIEISSVNLGNFNNYYLAYAYLLMGDFISAKSIIEKAQGYDEPKNNHNASTLHGIIALRQGESETAQEAFAKSIVQADEILAKTPDYYDALDAKGLALSGLALCEVGKEGGRRTEDRGKYVDEAMEAFHKARKIAPHAGIVRSNLRLFDEPAKCDEEGILKDVRQAVEGK